jgi:hypothetical protein
MKHVSTLMSVPNSTHVTHKPPVPTLLDPSTAHVTPDLLAMVLSVPISMNVVLCDLICTIVILTHGVTIRSAVTNVTVTLVIL